MGQESGRARVTLRAWKSFFPIDPKTVPSASNRANTFTIDCMNWYEYERLPVLCRAAATPRPIAQSLDAILMSPQVPAR